MRIAFFSCFLVALANMHSADFQKEVCWQSIQGKFVKKFIKKNDKMTISESRQLILNTTNSEEAFRVGMLTALIQASSRLTQVEVDAFWEKDANAFLVNIAAYVAGKLVGVKISRKYLDIGLKCIEKNNTDEIDELRLQDVCIELSKKLAEDPKNQYLRLVLATITSKQAILLMNKALAANVPIQQVLELAVASEYALAWIDEYVFDEKSRTAAERKLLKLPAEVLRLAALRALNRANGYPKALAAYTLAGAKGPCRDLNRFVAFLIANKQTQAFEPFLCQH
jgi:hypothetical protein